MSDEPIRHFLVVRLNGKLDCVRAFDDMDEALAAYEAKERELGCRVLDLDAGKRTLLYPDSECVLLGADRLATLISTHGSWFDEDHMNAIHELLGGSA